MENISSLEYIEVKGARVHNLKNIDVTIPRNQLVVITGLSGSGKSSLAFDTIYAEGQRRYIETFSSYARQFLGNLEKPDFDSITGLSPVISIEQKTVSKNPRSTVGTITEIYDFLRLLFARAGTAYSYNSNEEMIKYTDENILSAILENYNDKTVTILSPVVKGRKGHYRDLFEKIRQKGFLRARINGEMKEITPGFRVDRYKTHNIEVIIDRLDVTEENRKRLLSSIRTALKLGKGSLMTWFHKETENATRHFSTKYMCPTSGIAYEEPAPNSFSFNSPYGSCQSCNGLGEVPQVDQEKLIPDPELSIKQGGIAPLGKYKNNWTFKQVEAILALVSCNLDTPIQEIPEETISKVLTGTSEILQLEGITGINHTSNGFEGIIDFIIRHAEETTNKSIQRWAKGFMNKVHCPVCDGTRLKKESLFFKIDQKNISQISNLDLSDLMEWLVQLPSKLNVNQNKIASEILKELISRTQFLLDVGLEYLSLSRTSGTLSGGEAQRIRLATQIGTELVGVLYILDEPSIGLHQRDNTKLIQSLKKLRDLGNSVIVVEHDREMIEESDYVIEIGPGAGALGGHVLESAKPTELKHNDSFTAGYLNGSHEIEIPKERRKPRKEKIKLTGTTGNNLKNLTVEFPLGVFTCITGVSGSGKSSLVNHTLYPILNKHIYNGVKEPLPYESIEGLEHIDKVINIDQSPIGRTPRSNPATYTGIFNDIRSLFALLNESKIRGYKPGRFSFNIKGGRCETCKGAGIKTIEMNFLPDVYVECETCRGKRYNRETLEIRFKGKSISDILDMTIGDALLFFDGIPNIHKKLDTLNQVGLSYVKLGQASTTLSGGEAQRIKLSTELAKKDTGNTFYILDEPTTGLHFEDIRILLDVLQKLVESGNTVLVIEHNLDIIKVADYIIDIGPNGGQSGGQLLCEGTPEEVQNNEKSYTSKYLKLELSR